MNNNQVQFACLWCCVPPDFVAQINNFFNLVLFSTAIHKRRGNKLISKTIKYKLDSSSKKQFVFLYPKYIQKVFWKTIDFVKNLEMTQTAEGGGSCSLRHYFAMHTKIDMRFPPNEPFRHNKYCTKQIQLSFKDSFGKCEEIHRYFSSHSLNKFLKEFFAFVHRRFKRLSVHLGAGGSTIKGNAQFIQKVTFEPLIDFKQNHCGNWKC